MASIITQFTKRRMPAKELLADCEIRVVALNMTNDDPRAV